MEVQKGSIERREHWATRFGLILAMAGNAVGFGNFLRFPVQAASNGGGAFMIPYFVALLLLGIPLMWVEWSLGRLGGSKGHGTAPGMFEMVWKNRAAKYLGLLGIALPLFVVIFYVYIESWTLAYSYYSAIGVLQRMPHEQFETFNKNLLGGQGYWPIYGFFIATVLLNWAVMSRGISRGIERLAKFALPLLFVFAIVLAVRVFTLGSPVPGRPEQSVWNGLSFLWNPDLSRLSSSTTWLAATGQVFFTLSVGFGVISCYASYLKRKQDIALSGLTTVATNEFAEVILGGSLAIPLAFAFLGGDEVVRIAREGSFSLGFVAMPAVFQQLPVGQVLSTLWFLLLFFAGITSSVALAQAAISFMEDEFGWSRQAAAGVVWLFIFACANLVVFGSSTIDELNFWAATVGITIFALVEVILFVWVFGPDKAWNEINYGADIRIPKAMYYILKYITPVFLVVLLVAWIVQDGPEMVLMTGVTDADRWWRWGARVLMLVVLVGLSYMIHRSRHLREDEARGIGK